MKEKEKFEKEKAKLQNELESTKLRLANAISYQDELEQRNNSAEDTIMKLEEQIEVFTLTLEFANLEVRRFVKRHLDS